MICNTVELSIGNEELLSTIIVRHVLYDEIGGDFRNFWLFNTLFLLLLSLLSFV